MVCEELERRALYTAMMSIMACDPETLEVRTRFTDPLKCGICQGSRCVQRKYDEVRTRAHEIENPRFRNIPSTPRLRITQHQLYQPPRQGRSRPDSIQMRVLDVERRSESDTRDVWVRIESGYVHWGGDVRIVRGSVECASLVSGDTGWDVWRVSSSAEIEFGERIFFFFFFAEVVGASSSSTSSTVVCIGRCGPECDKA